MAERNPVYRQTGWNDENGIPLVRLTVPPLS